MKDAIAGFMAVPAEDVTILRSGSTRGIATIWVQVDGGSDPARFRLSKVDGEDAVIQMTNLAYAARSTADVGMDAARKRAAGLVAGQYARWGADMEETEAKRLPIGSYLITWRRFTPERYETGDFVSVTVHGGSGEPASYVASYASRSRPPSIDRQHALSLALEEVRTEAGPDVAATVDDARCVLSLPQLDLGPVWIVSVTLAGNGHQHGLTTVVIDGLTGKVVPESHAQAPDL
ncbi:MAG: hypothetical protein R6V07_02780 [Armatimonadota bacterium]